MGTESVGSSGTANTYNAVFTDKKQNMVSVEDFLTLMVAQLKNQDFMNPVDDTQYVTQLAQFSAMQQMQELAAYSKSSYAATLVGKNVTAAKYSVSGALQKDTGAIEKISLVDNEYRIYVNGKSYTLEQIMEINQTVETQGGAPQADPSGLAIEASRVTSDSVMLRWPEPTSNTTVAEKLTYTVYYSTDPAFDTVSEVERNGEPVGEQNRARLTSESLKGLEADTAYYVNVVVTDGRGIKAVYQKATFHTQGNA
jgi:hypothetical protein